MFGKGALIFVTDDSVNSSEINIQAALMVVNGEFLAENYGSRGVGWLRLSGSMVRGIIGTHDGGNASTSFYKHYRYDQRFKNISLPYYPSLKSLHLAYWWE